MSSLRGAVEAPDVTERDRNGDGNVSGGTVAGR